MKGEGQTTEQIARISELEGGRRKNRLTISKVLAILVLGELKVLANVVLEGIHESLEKGRGWE